MKIVPVRVISIVAVCAALVGACESDYDELSEDLLEPGWGEDAGKLPSCTPMDASTGGGTDAGSQDTGTSDTGTNGDSGGNGDSGSNGDSGGSDAGEADTGTPDAGAPDAA